LSPLLDAAEKLSIAAKSHSSSISDDEGRRHPRDLISPMATRASRPVARQRACRGNPNASHPCSVEGHASRQEGRDTRAKLPPSASWHRTAPAKPCCPATTTAQPGPTGPSKPQAAPSAPRQLIVAQDCWRPGKASCRTGPSRLRRLQRPHQPGPVGPPKTTQAPGPGPAPPVGVKPTGRGPQGPRLPFLPAPSRATAPVLAQGQRTGTPAPAAPQRPGASHARASMGSWAANPS